LFYTARTQTQGASSVTFPLIQQHYPDETTLVLTSDTEVLPFCSGPCDNLIGEDSKNKKSNNVEDTEGVPDRPRTLKFKG